MSSEKSLKLLLDADILLNYAAEKMPLEELRTVKVSCGWLYPILLNCVRIGRVPKA